MRTNLGKSVLDAASTGNILLDSVAALADSG